jgi:UDP-N-acetylmuramyl tripeptide synthase
MLLRLAPRAIRMLAKRLPDGLAVVSATNGKTTTARMLAAMLEAAGRAVVHNRAGANTHWGVCTALAEERGDIGVFEIDEAWLPLLVDELHPRLLVLGNLFRDRLDGYGELDRLLGLWRDLLQSTSAPAAVVANADDPMLAGSGGALTGTMTAPVLFGIEHAAVAGTAPGHAHEGRTCRRCDARLEYARVFVGQLGHFRCPRCGGSRPRPTVIADDVREEGLDATRATFVDPAGAFEIRIGLPGLHNVYNALAATAAAGRLGLGPESIRAGLASLQPPFGRGEVVTVHGRKVRLMLVKNPVGVNEALRLLEAHGRSPLHLWLALNDGEADGRDVSWIWDADFERLSGSVSMATCSGRRAGELAMRLKYAGWDCALSVREDLDASFRSALERAPESLVALPTYTALLGLRTVFNRLGVSVADWERTARGAP